MSDIKELNDQELDETSGGNDSIMRIAEQHCESIGKQRPCRNFDCPYSGKSDPSCPYRDDAFTTCRK